MKKHIGIIRIILLFSLIPFYLTDIPHARSSEKDKQIIGWIEYVTILPENLKIKAKLDTGARNSSLNAVNIVEVKRGGDTFVRFDLTNWKGRIETMEAKVIRMAKIKQHNSELERRPVIRIGICLDKVYKEVEVNLVDRSNFNYQLLIGRSFLKGEFAIDPSKTFTIKTDCRKVLRNE
ncbi:MAG: ATP-dependent zinc protease [Deltaproteobacteria bacterium]|nr:ATP-dependent zinc protease [Deltaproteobacteria bacterium]